MLVKASGAYADPNARIAAGAAKRPLGEPLSADVIKALVPKLLNWAGLQPDLLDALSAQASVTQLIAQHPAFRNLEIVYRGDETELVKLLADPQIDIALSVVRSEAERTQPPIYRHDASMPVPISQDNPPPLYADEAQPPPEAAPPSLFPAGMSPLASIGGMAPIPQPHPPRPKALPPQQLQPKNLGPAHASQLAGPIAAPEPVPGLSPYLAQELLFCRHQFVAGLAGDLELGLELRVQNLIRQISVLEDEVKLEAFADLYIVLATPTTVNSADSARLARRIFRDCLKPAVDAVAPCAGPQQITRDVLLDGMAHFAPK